nr:immunoglobulin light chain junction region [Macaca mulatta]
CQHYYSTPFSF